MAIVTCGRCGKGYSDKVYPACPACGGNPDSAPERRAYAGPGGTAPGTPPPPGITPGVKLALVAALALIGYGVFKSVRPGWLSSPAVPAPAAPAAPQVQTAGTASATWGDRVEPGVRMIAAGQGGVDLAVAAVRALHEGVQSAYLMGTSVNQNGKEAVVSFSISWIDRKGAAFQTGVDWYISERAGHVHAGVSADSSTDPAVHGAGRALNHYFRGTVYPALMGQMSGEPARLAAPPSGQLAPTPAQPRRPADRPTRFHRRR